MQSSGWRFGVASVFVVVIGCGPPSSAPRPPHDPIATDVKVATGEVPPADPPERSSAGAAQVDAAPPTPLPPDAGVAARDDGSPTRPPPPPSPCDLRPGEFTKVHCTPDKTLPSEVRGRVVRRTQPGGFIALELVLDRDPKMRIGQVVELRPAGTPRARPWIGKVARSPGPKVLVVHVYQEVDVTDVVVRRHR